MSEALPQVDIEMVALTAPGTYVSIRQKAGIETLLVTCRHDGAESTFQLPREAAWAKYESLSRAHRALPGIVLVPARHPSGKIVAVGSRLQLGRG